MYTSFCHIKEFIKYTSFGELHCKYEIVIRQINVPDV